jgi:hypothetical protein
VSEDNQWRQLGSIVNAVLLDTRTKAMRAGAVSRPAPRPFAPRIVQAPAHAANGLGNGFAAKKAPAPSAPPAPVQLELPFGIAATSNMALGQARSPRGARSM